MGLFGGLKKKNQNVKKSKVKINKKLLFVVTFVVSLVVIITIGTIIYNVSGKKEKTCLVQFDTLGGTLIESQNIVCGDKILKPTSPEKEGFEFITWHLTGEVYDFDKIVNSDIILIAEWKIKEETEIVKVNFNTNGGTLMLPIDIAKGTSISEPINPTKSGYKFVEWEYEGEKFDFNTIINSNITLNAKWEKLKDESNSLTSENKTNTTNNNENSNSNSNNNQNSCSTTSSGVKSCIPMDFSWDSLKGTWYLKGTDDVMISFSEDSSNYIYESIRFQFYPSKVDYDIYGKGEKFPKNLGYTATSIALYINVTEVTSSSITIDNKYTFYRQKNYPSHIETDLEKQFKNLEGTWYLEGYYKDVYVKFTGGIRYDEKVLFYEEHNFCSVYGKAYSSSCYGTGYFSYYLLNDSTIGIGAYGWSYDSGYLYNTSSGSKLKFSKTPTSTPVKDITISKKELNLFIGETQNLTFTITPNNATNKNVLWSSSDNSVVTVSNGYVVAKKAGKAVITVTTEDGNKSAFCAVTVSNIDVSGISISDSNLNLIRGDSYTLTATITPDNATNKNVDWLSSDTSVATVINGKVTATKAGSTVITVKSNDGSYTATCNVTVTNPSLSGKGSIGISTISSSSGISRGVSVTVTASGGTGIYNYYYIKLYKDETLIGETTNNSINSLFVNGYTNGSYSAEFEIHDSDGTIYTGSIEITTISGF